jgi:hypothetical protein
LEVFLFYVVGKNFKEVLPMKKKSNLFCWLILALVIINHKIKIYDAYYCNNRNSTIEFKPTLVYLFSILLILAVQAPAAWSWTADTDQNTPISTAVNHQLIQTIASDGAGGSIIVWRDERSGIADIYAQRVDSSGKRLWENGVGSGDYNGIPISTAIGEQHQPRIVSDGAGGAVIIWEDPRSGDANLYAQKIDSNGNRLWENGVGSGDYNGVIVSAASGSQRYPELIYEDTSGMAIIAWQDWRNVMQADIYVQKIDSLGNRVWENGVGSGDYDGIPISTVMNNQVLPYIVDDGSGGAIIMWRDYRGGSSSNHIYAQRIDSNGNRLWENGIGSGDFDGIPIITEYVYDPRIVSNGLGGAVITWYAQRGGPFDIYAQRIDSSGNRLWENGVGSGDYNGIPISAYFGEQKFPKIISYGVGGAIIIWSDLRGGWPNFDIYAQRIDSSGKRLWENVTGSGNYEGIPISVAPGRQINPCLVEDSSGGAIIAWTDERGAMYTSDIYAQRIDATGNRLWENGGGSGDYDGIPISTARIEQYNPVIVRDGSGGAVVAWIDYRLGTRDIFAQRVYSNGDLSTVSTPSNLLPADMDTTGPKPTLASTPFEDTAGEVTHAASQWQISERSDFAPDTIQATLSDDNGYIEYTLPFMFPFFGRTITTISVNTNGLIEMLETGETCYECGSEGTHAEGNHVNTIDAIFASNDDLETEDGYLNIYDQGNHVMVEWFGSTMYDADSNTNPVHFQVELHSDGTMKWNFKEMNFEGYDYDMYSGIYPIGSAEIDVGYAISTQSSWVFDPVAQIVNNVSFNWDTPKPYFLFDSNEMFSNLTLFTVPAAADLAYCNTYFWKVRYRSSIGDWTPWSTPTRFAVAPLNDFESDGDVDGDDLAEYIDNDRGITLSVFANEFGIVNCQ